VAKTRRSKGARNRRKIAPQARRPRRTLHDYPVSFLQFVALEAQVARNRTDLDIQLRRIAQLQDELNMIKKALSAPASLAAETPLVLPKVTVES
jgi:hypothetical protein